MFYRELLILFILVSYLLFIKNSLYYNSNVLKGSIKCIDKDVYKTCVFENIYYSNRKWIIYIDNQKQNYCINAYAKKLGRCWKYIGKSFEENKYINLKKVKYISSISIPFKLTYSVNYGHALWDDLYSIYTSIVKIGYKNNRFNLVLEKKYRNTHYLNDIINVLQKFSKGNNIYLDSFNKEDYILFKKVIVGSSHQCQRCVTLDYSLKYSREYNITKLIRNRMYEVFSIKPEFNYPIRGIIVHNKRYNELEKNILNKVINHYKFNKYITLQYIDYKNYSTFEQQLNLLSKTHIYISGPGTGLLNFPFIADPGVIIHLGHIHFGCPQYLEQYILEGSPHFKTIYYSPQIRMNIMNYSYVINLIEEAKRYIENNNIIHINKEENLNDIGKLYVKICNDHKNLCEMLIKEYDWGYGKCRGIWAENVVFFPSLYKRIPQLNSIVKLYNSSKNLGCRVGINNSKQSQWC